MICNKNHINDSLASKFCDVFWSELKISLLISYKKIFLPGELTISQKRVVIKLIEKKGRDKKLIKNWRSISLVNIDGKLISKVLLKRTKNIYHL